MTRRERRLIVWALLSKALRKGVRPPRLFRSIEVVKQSKHGQFSFCRKQFQCFRADMGIAVGVEFRGPDAN